MNNAQLQLNDRTRAEVNPFTVTITQNNILGTRHCVVINRDHFKQLIRESGILLDLAGDEQIKSLFAEVAGA
jgi:hypothetical protein